MKIYTKTGDNGTTMLFGGGRVKKYHARINAYGTLDELNAHIGLLKDQNIHPTHQQNLAIIQERLFAIGAHLAVIPQKNQKITLPELYLTDIQHLENEIDTLETQLPPLRNFILPGGHQTVSFCHIARCVCRRAERLIVQIADNEPIQPVIIPYLNRLSDFLFVLARKLTHELNATEIPWIPPKTN